MVSIRFGSEVARQAYPTTLLLYETAESNPRTTFSRFIAPRIISAFVDWQNFIEQFGSTHQIETMREGVSNPNYFLHYDFVSSFRAVGGKYKRWDDLWYQWGVEPGNKLYQGSKGLSLLRDEVYARAPELLATGLDIELQSIPDDKELLATCEAFFELCRYVPWIAFREATKIPYGARLDKSVKGLPTVIYGGDMVWEQEFNRYFVLAHIRVPKFRNSYFGYLAEKYKQESDLKIKAGVFKTIFEMIPAGSVEVLDVGCGIGLANQYKSREDIKLFGVDENQVMVEMADTSGETAIVGKIENSEIGDRELFDHAIMSFVDYWVADSDKAKVFLGVKRNVKPGGKLIFNVHKPKDGWEEQYRKILMDECGYKSVSFSQELIERTGGGVYTAYYISAEI